jgi:TonB family protein
MRYVPQTAIVFALLMSSAAYAQPAATGTLPGNSQIPTSPVANARSLSPKAQVTSRVPLNCDAYLSPGFKIPFGSAPTFFWFRFDVDGNYHDISLYRSSGNNDLDQAALACANNMHVDGKPFTQGGTPIEVTWVGAISWNYPRHYLFLPDPLGKDHLCGQPGFIGGYLRAGLKLKPLGGRARVSYRVATDGSVKDATIKRSAGNGSLDRAALECVSAWRYLPAFHNGVPVEIDREAEVGWQLRH